MNLPIGAAIRHVRKQRGWSATYLATKAGVDRTYLCRVERGQMAPGLEQIVRLSNALEVEPYKLVKLICRMVA